MEFDDPTKAVLKPRVEGENIKVAETVLRRRDRNIEAKGRRAARIAKQKKIRGTVKTKRVVPPEKLVKLWKKRTTDKRRLKRIPNKKKSKVSHFGRVLFVQRNRRPGGSDATKKVLKELRIMSFNTGVFLPNTVETLDKLKIIAPFASWGNPCYEVVDDMMHKCAAIESKTQKVRLSDNALIEEHLGEVGMFCVEDLVNEIFSCGPNFTEVTQKLCPFTLGDFTDRQAKGFIREQEMLFGNLKFKINDRIRDFLGTKKTFENAKGEKTKQGEKKITIKKQDEEKSNNKENEKPKKQNDDVKGGEKKRIREDENEGEGMQKKKEKEK